MPHTANVDRIALEDLCDEEEYLVETQDHWTLVITRYKPKKVAFEQPLAGVPFLLVHGFSQNRHAWTSGEFVKNMAFFGADIHILELRGHGKSSTALQYRRHRRDARPLPGDIQWAWDVDSYFMFDLPAAIREVKRKTGRRKMVYVGHSMGGMLGYGLASWQQEDFLGLVTIGAPSDIGRGFPLIQMLALVDLLGVPAVDALLWELNTARKLSHATRKRLADLVEALPIVPETVVDKLTPSDEPAELKFQVVPVDVLLRTVQKFFNRPGTVLGGIPKYIPLMWNPERANPERIKSLLNIGGGPEPRAVVRQFARWIRKDELKCYKLNYDFKKNFDKIEIPVAIVFGDQDRIADLKSTSSIYKNARSNYLLWRPVKGNSHIDLTMGHDIRQICYDIKNLADYALKHQHKEPSLPRVEDPAAPAAQAAG